MMVKAARLTQGFGLFCAVTSLSVVVLLAGCFQVRTEPNALSLIRSQEALGITGLFGTGVNTAGVPLPDGSIDPNYTMTVSADGTYPPPNARVVNAGYPIGGGAWVNNPTSSKWISARADGSAGISGGSYNMQTTFTISAGITLSSVSLSGRWACDDSCSIRLNGSPITVASGNYSALTNFAIPTGSPFVTGSNTLTFIFTNGGSGPGAILVDSISGSFVCAADSDCNAGFYCDNTNPAIAGCAAKIANNNPLGQTTPYATGVNNSNVSLADGAIDRHYALVTSSDPAFPGPNAFVIDNAYPIPPWVANSTSSRWTGVQPAGSNGASGGVYTYRQTFSLNGVNPSFADLTGNWACDDTCIIKLNGTTVVSSSGYSAYTAFNIPPGSPFVSGINTLDFIVTNSGGGPTGLRVDGLGGSVFSSTPTSCNTVLPPIPGAIGTRACSSGVCDSTDDKCGYAVGSGPCTAGNAAIVCRTGTCSGGVCSGTCNGNFRSGSSSPCGSTLPICNAGTCISDPSVPGC